MNGMERKTKQNRWKDSCKRDVASVGLKEEDVLDRTKWNNAIKNHSGNSRWDNPEDTKKRRRVAKFASVWFLNVK